MKNFIKAHPYLSCTGLALATDALGVFFLGDKKSAFREFLVCTTLPSMVITAIDQYGHQNLTESKPLQYTLTAVESVLSFPSIVSLPIGFEDSFSAGCRRFTDYFKHLIDTDTSNTSNEIKVYTIGILIQSLGFKYILDSAKAQPEIENLEESPIDIKYDVNII